MSRAAIGAVLATLIVVLTGTAYLVTTSKLKGDIKDDVKQRVSNAQNLLIQNSSLEMLRLLKHAEALALDPRLVQALGTTGETPDESKGADPLLAEDVFKQFRDDLKKGEVQPDIMAMTDDAGRLVALMVRSKPVINPVPDAYLQSGKIKYPALAASIENQVVTSEVWDYEGSGPMKVTVAPILDQEVNATLGTVLVAYPITAPEARRQQELLAAQVVYFYGEQLHVSSFGSAKEQQTSLGKTLFAGGLAKQALSAENGLGDIRFVTYDGDEYIATTGRLPRYASKVLGEDYPTPSAGAMVLISLTEATSSVSTAGFAIILVGFFGIIIMLLAISITSKRILQPVEEIEIGVNDIINGNLDRVFEPVGSDLDGLGNALNVMLARLLGRAEPGEEEFDEEGNIIRQEVQLPTRQTGQMEAIAADPRQAEAENLAAEPMDAYLQRVYEEFAAAQVASGSEAVGYDPFVKKLMANEASLKQKYGAREVRFKVVTTDGKVSLKPVPIM